MDSDAAEDPREQPPAAEDLISDFTQYAGKKEGMVEFQGDHGSVTTPNLITLSQISSGSFVDRKLKEHGLAGSAPAKPRTLITEPIY